MRRQRVLPLAIVGSDGNKQTRSTAVFEETKEDNRHLNIQCGLLLQLHGCGTPFKRARHYRKGASDVTRKPGGPCQPPAKLFLLVLTGVL